MSTTPKPYKPPVIKIIERVIFESRWLLVAFYAGLIIALVLYAFVFAKHTWHIILETGILNPNTAMLAALELVDMAMVAALIKMITTGGYNSFISKTHGYAGENISSGMLKIKMSTSLIGVSSIHLLQTFLDQSVTYTDPIFIKQLIIHGTFLVGAMVLAYIEFLHEKGESLSTKENTH